tara:strand:+ start:6867 stop:7811 length:945 start_codon:yes stop_codon:yes gene_type:complete
MLEKNTVKYKQKKILIVGSGRWSKEILNELLNIFIKKKNIFLFTNKKKNKYLQDKFSIKQIKNFSQIKKEKITHTIVCNKTSKHYETFKNLKKYRTDILIEKPLTNQDTQNFKIFKFSKKSKNLICLSSQLYFSNFFLYLKKFLIKKNFKVKKIIFKWYDQKNEIRKGSKKSQNTAIKYVIDVFYHFNSILNFLRNNKKAGNTIINNLYYKKNEIYFDLFGISIFMHTNRNSKDRKRQIEIYNKKNQVIKVNFKKVPKFSYNNYKYDFKKLDKCLSNQLKTFLSDDLRRKKDILVRNKENLFINLKILNNKVKK